ncbi:MAG: sensor histidine kinase [Lachnospira pectinoschiza]
MDDYMYLQQMRFGQRIKYMCDVDNSSLDELVPDLCYSRLLKMQLYTDYHLYQKVVLYVRGFKKDDKMWLSIADTGVGIEKDKLDSIRKYLDNIFALPDTETAASSENDSNYADSEINRKTVGVGIGNIAYRVKGMYNNSGMKIYSRKNHGTVIQIYFGNNSK